MAKKIVAIDQGTTSSRAIVFDIDGHIITQARYEHQQYFPASGWVEHDANELWQNTLRATQEVLTAHQDQLNDFIGIGITNQRETTVVWHCETGEPIYNAIVWQDRRTAQWCDQLKQAGHEANISEKTGLLLDPYFSATKIHWLLEHVPGARQLAETGKLLFGTIDCFLVWKLTQGQSHATDITNASRTLLFNIKEQRWDPALLNLFSIPEVMLPKVLDCNAEFGIASVLAKPLPILGVAGDQQAAMIGQACFNQGMAKATYGTGGFIMLNTGDEIVQSKKRLLSTVAYRINNNIQYALEGSIFCAGSTIKWLRDKLNLINKSSDSEICANAVDDNSGVYLIPAFTGLGAPHWQADIRASIVGLTLDSNYNHIVRAGLESVVYSTNDLLNLMIQEADVILTELRVDGGMVENNWFLQFLADILRLPIKRAVILETTALGVAYLVALTAGYYKDLSDIHAHWAADKNFEPQCSQSECDQLYQGWQQAIESM